MSTQSFAFASSPSENYFVQTIVNEEKSLFFVASLEGESAHQAWKKIQTLLPDRSVSPQEFSKLFEQICTDFQKHLIQCVALHVTEGVVVAAVQKGKIWLNREGKVGVLVESNEDVKIVQGKLKDADTFVLENQYAAIALEDFFPQVLQEASDAELLVPNIMAQLQEAEYPGAVGLVIKVDLEEAPAETSSLLETVAPTPIISVRKNSSRNFKKLRLPRIRFSGTKHIKKLVALIILVIVLVGFFAVRKQWQVRQAEQFIEPYEEKIATIENLAKSDKLAARDQALQLLQEWKTQKDVFNPSTNARLLTDTTETRLQELYGRLSGRTEFSVLPVFYDFRLVQSDFLAGYTDLDGNIGMFLDPAKSALIQLNLDNKQQLILPIGQYSSLIDMVFSREKVYLLSNGLYEFPIDSKNNAVKIINEDDRNRAGKYLGIFENFLYVLNPEERNIFRYDITSDSDTPSSIGWIQDKKDLDFSQITSLAIDGNVWLGTAQGKIIRYERGLPIEFVPVGLEKELSSPLKIFTQPDFSNLYILEPSQQRVVVLSKDGTYVREFVHSSLEAGSDLIAREDTGRVYVIAGSLLYEMEM